jgi:hypothetical protein
LSFLQSCRPGSVAQSFELSDYASQNVIRQRFEFFPRGRLYLDGIAIHANDRAIRSPLSFFLSGVPFSLRRDSEISPSQKSYSTVPYFLGRFGFPPCGPLIGNKLDSAPGSIPRQA